MTRLGFDPRTASAQKLIAADLPARSNASASTQAYQSWLKAATSRVSSVTHGGWAAPSIVHGPIKLSDAARVSDIGSFSNTSLNWSGYQGLGYQGTFGIVSAEWYVPTVVSTPPGTYYSSMWVGIDGGICVSPYSCSSDVFQDGSEQDSANSGGHITTTYYLWREFYPYDPSSIQVMGTSPGNDIYCQVFKYIQNDRAAAEFWCENETTGQVYSFAEWVDNRLVNNTGEWIVERPEVSGTISSLADYGTADLWGAWTQTTTGTWYAYSQISEYWNLYQISMTNSSGTTLSNTYNPGFSTIDWQWYQSN